MDGVILVGTAPHGRLALAKLEQTPADLVLLDVEMPEMDGPEALKEIRRRHPATSVVMISGANLSSAEITLRCLELGALDFLRKPEGSDPEASRERAEGEAAPAAAPRADPDQPAPGQTRAGTRPAPRPEPAGPAPGRPPPPAPRPARMAPAPDRIDVVGIGVSTGGPNALAEVIPRLPADFPVPDPAGAAHAAPVHRLPGGAPGPEIAGFRCARPGTASRSCPGGVYIAPGGKHMVVRRLPDGDAPIIGLNENPPENSCRPSVDVLFRSLAAQYEGNMLAVVMTGMGTDGCEGVRAMKRRGAASVRPASVSCTRTRLRSNSRTPSSFSKSRICRLRAGWATRSFSAARLKFNVSTTAQK